MAELMTDPRTVLEDARSTVAGDVLGGDDDGYDTARMVWNGMIDRRPLAVVRAADADDVAATIGLARRHGLPLAVRGGGHSVAGHGTVEAGILLDLSAMRQVEVDTEEQTVRVAAGATLADVDRATHEHGLAVPLGVISATGVAGLTLGGGVGWLTRAHGLAADNLIEADVVTADGAHVRASDTQDTELLWGLRGGGGNFGVVTSFTFRAHPLPPEVYASNLVYGQDRWHAALAAWERWTRDLPDQMQSILTVGTFPADVGVGTAPVLIIGCAWASPDHAEGERLLRPLRDAAPPDDEDTGLQSWIAVQTAMDEVFPTGARAYWKNTAFDRLDEEVIEVLTRRGAEQRWVGTAFDIHHMGGAFARVTEDATPFPGRGSRYWLNIYGFWADPADDEHHTAFVRGFAADMAPFATGATYVNFMGTAEDADPRSHAQGVYGTAKLDRLRALKTRLDPDNVFRLNHNILPGDGARGGDSVRGVVRGQ